MKAHEPLARFVDFASCYVYSPSGGGAASARSRSLCATMKTGAPASMSRHARCVMRHAALMPALAEFFREVDVLVPIPASESSRAGRSSVPGRLADALISEGLGARNWKGLRRSTTVIKSSTAPPGGRPSVLTHYDSFAVLPAAGLPHAVRILLIDDVVTKGRTLLAAAMRLQDTFPEARIRAFALFRTLGFKDDLESLLAPCVGRICWRSGEAHRSP